MLKSYVIIVSAQSKELGTWVFYTWSDLRVRIWGMLGQGIGDLDSGLTIVFFSVLLQTFDILEYDMISVVERTLSLIGLKFYCSSGENKNLSINLKFVSYFPQSMML